MSDTSTYSMAGDTEVNRNHTVFVYKTKAERHKFLAAYFAEGLATNQLCIFVSPGTTNQIMYDFQRYGLDISEAVKRGAFRIYDMKETYLPHGEFAAEFMVQNVKQFIIDARKAGYAGLYTAGEMSWMYDNPRFWHKAARYEAEIDELLKHHRTFTALCIYPTTTAPFIEDIALKTHPRRVFMGGIKANEDYVEVV